MALRNPFDRYAEAFHKVFANIDKVLEIFDKTETYLPLMHRMGVSEVDIHTITVENPKRMLSIQ